MEVSGLMAGQLPVELNVEIVLWLSAHDLCSVLSTNWTCYHMIDDYFVWYELAAKHFPNAIKKRMEGASLKSVPWKQEYKYLEKIECMLSYVTVTTLNEHYDPSSKRLPFNQVISKVFNDKTFRSIFLVVHHLYCTEEMLADTIIKQYTILQQQFNEGKIDKIEKRRFVSCLCMILKEWSTFWKQWPPDPVARDKVICFLVSEKEELFCGHLLRYVHLHMIDNPPPVYILPEIPAQLDVNQDSSNYSHPVLRNDVVEMAKQITLLESKYWKMISPKELLGRTWILDRNRAPFLNFYCNWHQAFMKWVYESVSGNMRPRLRNRMITNFLNLAEECYNLNNWSTASNIIYSLQKYGLNPFFEENKSFLPIYTGLKKCMGMEEQYDSVVYKMKRLLNPGIPNIVPLLEMIMVKDVRLVNFQKDDLKLLNLRKCRFFVTVIENWFCYQTGEYAFAANERLQEVIKSTLFKYFPTPLAKRKGSNILPALPSKRNTTPSKTTMAHPLPQKPQQPPALLQEPKTIEEEQFTNEINEQYFLFQSLPLELHIQILLYLDIKSMLNVSLVSKHWKVFIGYNQVWIPYLIQSFPRASKKYKVDQLNWKELKWKDNYMRFKKKEAMIEILDSIYFDIDFLITEKIIKDEIEWISFNDLIHHFIILYEAKTKTFEPNTIIYAHYTFCDDETLFEALKKVYYSILDLNRQGKVEDMDCRIMLIRIVNFMKKWMVDSNIWEPDKVLEKQIILFLETERENPISGRYVSLLAKRFEDKEENVQNQKDILNFIQNPSFKTTELNVYQFYDINPTVLAEQLSLIVFPFWAKVKPRNFFGHIWRLDEKDSLYLSRLTTWSKRTIEWVRNYVIEHSHNPLIVSHLIRTAEQTFRLNDWESTGNIMVGLRKTLTQSVIKELPVDIQTKYKTLVHSLSLEHMEDRYSNMSVILKTPPAIPWIEVLVEHMDGLESEEPNFHPKQGYLINFKKCSQFFKSLVHWIYFQETPYHLQTNTNIQKYLYNSIFSQQFK